jgi:hypothetical protein
VTEAAAIDARLLHNERRTADASHNSCGRMSPAKFDGLHRQRAGDAAQTTSTTAEIN